MIRYIKQEMPHVNDMVRQECYYKVDTIGCLSHEELMDEMCRSGIARGQIELVLRTLRESMASLLLKGYSVRIDGLGRFNLSIGVKPDREVEEMDGGVRRNAISLAVRNLLFKPDKSFVKYLNGKCRFERGGTIRMSRCKLTVEERLSRAKAYIAQHGMMRISDYMALTGMRKTAAAKELRDFADRSSETGITAVGRGPSLLYK